MLKIFLKQNEVFFLDSETKTVTPGKQYTVSTQVTGFEGKPHSAYFGVELLDRNNMYLDRRIIWLNDFSGMKRQLKINFIATSPLIKTLYRINVETGKKSDCKYELLPLDGIIIEEHESKVPKTSDDEKNYFLPRPPELSSEDELTLEKNLVWVFSSTRSGTTWLATQLLTHDTFVIDEPRINIHLGSQAAGMPIGTTEIERSGNRPDYFFSFIYKNTWKYYLRKLILNRIFAQTQNINKKIIIKEPTAGEIGIETIAECLPNSKIIWLLRDGRDVVDSQVDARIHGFSKGGRFEDHEQNPLRPEQKLVLIKERANLWIKIIEKIEKCFVNHSQDSKFLVKYEDLRRNTFEEIKKIYKFLKIAIPDNKMEKLVEKYSFENIPSEKKGLGKFNRIATPGKWKENFSKEEQVLMDEIMGKTLKRLGYSLE